MNIYQENILDHSQNPRNWGQIKGADKVLMGANISCGDELQFFLKIDRAGKIKAVRWFGRACAICLASSSMLSEQIVDKNFKDVQKISTDDILRNLKIPLSPIRLKCALLPLLTLQKFKNTLKIAGNKGGNSNGR